MRMVTRQDGIDSWWNKMNMVFMVKVSIQMVTGGPLHGDWCGTGCLRAGERDLMMMAVATTGVKVVMDYMFWPLNIW